MKPKVLIFCDYYLPGIRGGGGMWTVVNLVNRLTEEYDFYVISRNHDGPRDRTPYSDILNNEWNDVGNSKAYYLPPSSIKPSILAELFETVDPDLVFLNSVFSRPSVMFLLARRLGRVSKCPVIIAPCGEFGDGAFRNKALKKRMFLMAASVLGLHKGLIWKATTDFEVKEIKEKVKSADTIEVAPDLPPKSILPDIDLASKPEKLEGRARLIFVSRIVRKKNLKFLLECLRPIETGEIKLEIVGPVEDEGYWDECRRVIAFLPENILVNVIGGLNYESVLDRLVNSHFFILPTLSENFGYVFLEAMAAGCPIVISDRTIWSNVEEAGAGAVLPLDDHAAWTAKIREFISLGHDDYEKTSTEARKFALDWLSNPSVEEATANIFRLALENGSKGPNN
jgi:glycosyltransferase involved in cell wall biosynthesis